MLDDQNSAIKSMKEKIAGMENTVRDGNRQIDALDEDVRGTFVFIFSFRSYSW
jgi:hypothetical protein